MPTASHQAVSTDNTRLETLYRLHNAHLVNYLVHQVNDRNHATAEDLAQETWLRVTKCAGTLRVEDSRAFGFISVVARHVVAEHYRLPRNHEKPTDFVAAPASLPVAGPITSPAPVLPASYTSVIAQLPPKQRTALLLRLDGLTLRAVASHTGGSHRTAADRISQAAATLRPVVTELLAR